MWKYSSQITIRWLYFVLSALLLTALLWQMSAANPEILTQTGLKAELTRLSVMAEYQPLWIWPLVFLATTLAMLTGVPSLLPFACLMVFSGFYPAFIITFLCQVFVTRICIHRAWKIADNDSYQKSLHPTLRSLLWQNQENFMKFAFWSRVYYAYPLRTIDYLTPMIQPDEKHLSSTLFPAAAAIFLRMLIPTLWLHATVRLAVNVAPDPAGDVSIFLMWSSALVAYTMIPRVPEFFVCPDSVKSILVQIDRSEVALQTNASRQSEMIQNSNASKAGSTAASLNNATRQAAEGS